MSVDLLEKIREAGLIGRGGAEFPTAQKWEMVKSAPGTPKAVICNASEGELGLSKDIYIYKHFTSEVLLGMKLAMDFLETRQAWFNFNATYYHRIKGQLIPRLRMLEKEGYSFGIYREPPSYIGGEETALLNAIEGKRVEPRRKPPFPSEAGLFGKPTLVHNVETLFNIAQVAEGTFRHERFCCLNGQLRHIGVFHLPDDWTIEELLLKTGNWPDFDFFVQVGGSASGVILNQNQLRDHKMRGAGGIEVYNAKIDPKNLLARWFRFYDRESCGKCTPCREGAFQLYKLIQKDGPIPWEKIIEIVDVMERTSFCALGRSLAAPVKSFYQNVWTKK